MFELTKFKHLFLCNGLTTSWNKIKAVFLKQIDPYAMNKETKQFILQHEHDDIFDLKLQNKQESEVDIDLALRQITGRQKIRNKVPLFYETEDLLYPVQLSLEQSSSEPTANYKSLQCKGNSLVDLTGGFGVDCFFISRQFKEVTYVERQLELCVLAKHNFNALGSGYINVIHADTEKYLEITEHVDWIFIDPARRSTSGKKVVLLSDCEPDISKLYPVLLERATQVMIKLSPMMDISAAILELPNTSEIHIISVENECKEVLLVLNQTILQTIQIKTINLRKNKENQVFDYNLEDESTAEVSYASEIGKYLYEPNASIMKSGAFKLTGNRFNIHKLHRNTHLYTSTELIQEFPGRIFEVTELWGNSKKELKEHCSRTPKANISTRNYPVQAEELRKKLKIKDGGDIYLFACTFNGDQKIIIQTKKTESMNILFES